MDELIYQQATECAGVFADHNSAGNERYAAEGDGSSGVLYAGVLDVTHAMEALCVCI